MSGLKDTASTGKQDASQKAGVTKAGVTKGAGVIAPFGGLFSRIVIASLCLGSLTIALIVTGFGFYTERLAAQEAQIRLERSIAILAPVIDGAVSQNMPQSARQILVNLVEEPGVVCVDYLAPVKDDTLSHLLINLPDGGCQAFDRLEESFIEVSLTSSSSGQYHFYIDEQFFIDDRNQQLAIIVAIALSTLVTVFILLSFVFYRLVLTPLDNLQAAMSASRPSKPALADIFRNDEIGAVSRTYNKLAAASRIYFARLEKSQKSLSESESKFKDMAEISGDWFYEMDADLRFTYISDRFFEITKIDPKSVIGKTRKQMMADRVITPKWQDHLDDLAARKAFKSFEYAIKDAAGNVINLSINGKPLIDEEGVFSGYRGTGSDVTAITNDRQLLEETNRNFGDSVTYASSIQRGLLPSKDTVSALFGEVSTIWQPKDLVGGDFYWVGQIGGARYLVFFDCTGHGVPGAFMTLITTSVLEKISAASPVALPCAQMLEQIHRGVAAQLGITPDKPGKDGLDCAVVKLVPSEGQLEFAGASADLFVMNDGGEVTRLRGARHTLGYQIFDQARTFESYHVPLANNSFVLTTDGLTTQIGEATKRVLGTRRVIEALQSATSHKPAAIVRTLGMALKRWQGSEERRDDVTILAFRPYGEG